MSADALTVVSESPEETERLGARLVDLLPHGGVIALRGDLASGKTCLVRGMERVCHRSCDADRLVDALALGMHNSVMCTEDLPFIDREAIAGLLAD